MNHNAIVIIYVFALHALLVYSQISIPFSAIPPTGVTTSTHTSAVGPSPIVVGSLPQLYYITITIGTPPREFRVQIVTNALFASLMK